MKDFDQKDIYYYDFEDIFMHEMIGDDRVPTYKLHFPGKPEYEPGENSGLVVDIETTGKEITSIYPSESGEGLFYA